MSRVLVLTLSRMDALQAVSSGTGGAGLDLMDVMEELDKGDMAARLASAEVRTIPCWCYSVPATLELNPVRHPLQTGTRTFWYISPVPVAGYPFLQAHIPGCPGGAGTRVPGQHTELCCCC